MSYEFIELATLKFTTSSMEKATRFLPRGRTAQLGEAAAGG